MTKTSPFCLAQIPQAMQPTVQLPRTTLPGSFELQAMTTSGSSIMLSMEMMLRGQATTQLPQPVQATMSMIGRPRSMRMASKGQDRSQSPSPRQP